MVELKEHDFVKCIYSPFQRNQYDLLEAVHMCEGPVQHNRYWCISFTVQHQFSSRVPAVAV